MSNQGPDAAEQLLSQIHSLQLALKRSERQLSVAHSTIEKYKITSAAQQNLSAILQAEKSKQEKLMALLLRHSPDIIIMVDQQRRFVFCTEAFLRAAHIVGFGLINGHSFSEVFRLFGDEQWMERMNDALQRAVRSGAGSAFDERIDFSASGKERDYTVSVTPVTSERGASEGALLIFHDITDLQREKERAERANRAKSDFLVTVSHEIRTPMNAIIGITDMLRKTPMNERQMDLLANMDRSSNLLLSLINDILDFSKIEAGSMQLMREPFSLYQLLDKLRSIYGVLMPQKGLNFTAEFAQDLPAVLIGDEKRLGQVLSNLLTNAFKYTGEGFVTLRAAVREGLLCFDVEDSGIGIRKEDMPRLFTAFEQFDAVKNKNVTGTGLGLSITRRLCELMNGEVSAASEYGRGSCFTVRIPFTAGSPEDLPREAEALFSFTAKDARVLVVDDIDINLMVSSAMLESYGINAQTATSGLEALQRAQNEAYDLIFMDHMMPGMDGVETVHRLRAMGGTLACVPIVALTANAVAGAQEMFLSSGFNDFISKPIDPKALSACLLKWLPRALIETAQ